MAASFHLFREHSTWFTRLLWLYWLVGTSVGIKATLRTRVFIFTLGPRMKEVGPIIDQHRLGSFSPLLVKPFSSGEGKVEEPLILDMNGHGRRPNLPPSEMESTTQRLHPTPLGMEWSPDDTLSDTLTGEQQRITVNVGGR